MRQFHILHGDVILLVKPGAALAVDMPECADVDWRVLGRRQGHGFGLDSDFAKGANSRCRATGQRRCRAEHA